MSNLTFTGERLVPGLYGKIAVEHLHRYAITIEFVKGKKVLDIACGEGYGSNLISKYAENVTGLDISDEAISHASKIYKGNNLFFKKGNALDIPLNNQEFDVVVCFETIEHVSDHKKMISELKRVLKPDGILIVSTPEKSVYSDQSNYSNPYHEKELYEEEFKELIRKEFKYFQIFYQKYIMGSLVISFQVKEKDIQFHSGDFGNFNFDQRFDQEYMIAICSNKELPLNNTNSFYSSESIDKDLVEEIVNFRIQKIKSAFRYRLIDSLFKPWDLIKRFAK